MTVAALRRNPQALADHVIAYELGPVSKPEASPMAHALWMFVADFVRGKHPGASVRPSPPGTGSSRVARHHRTAHGRTRCRTWTPRWGERVSDSVRDDGHRGCCRARRRGDRSPGRYRVNSSRARSARLGATGRMLFPLAHDGTGTRLCQGGRECYDEGSHKPALDVPSHWVPPSRKDLGARGQQAFAPCGWPVSPTDPPRTSTPLRPTLLPPRPRSEDVPHGSCESECRFARTDASAIGTSRLSGNRSI